MKIILLIYFTIFLTNYLVNGYKILVVSLLPSKSHRNLNIPITEILAGAGHKVTVISPFHKKDSPCRYVSIPEIYNYAESNDDLGFHMKKMSSFEIMASVIDIQKSIANYMFKNEAVLNFLRNESETFDLVIYEHISGDFLLGLGTKYDCPVIILSPIGIVDTLSKMISQPSSLATVPNLVLPLPMKMNLFQRAMNFCIHLLQELLDTYYLVATQKELHLKYFPEESEMESFEKATERISLVLMNTYPSMGIPRALLPNIIEIGGYHITDDSEPLTKDLQMAMDSAKNGVIYFSLGSVAKGVQMETKMKEAIVKSFSKLEQTVLWKFENEVPEKSDNVIIKKWMPQRKHPNLKLFITHGGLLSCTESVHFGVPLIVIPVFGDQPFNARMVEERGQGLLIEIDNVTESSLDWAINKMLKNKHYSETARRLQDLYNDRPISPLQAIVYYTEYVIRTKGAKHLSPTKLSWYSMLLLDVYTLLFITLTFVIYLIIACFKKMLHMNTDDPSDKNKKNK